MTYLFAILCLPLYCEHMDKNYIATTRAKTDFYSVAVGTAAACVSLPHIYNQVSAFQPLKDLQGIMMGEEISQNNFAQTSYTNIQAVDFVAISLPITIFVGMIANKMAANLMGNRVTTHYKIK